MFAVAGEEFWGPLMVWVMIILLVAGLFWVAMLLAKQSPEREVFIAPEPPPAPPKKVVFTIPPPPQRNKVGIVQETTVFVHRETRS